MSAIAQISPNSIVMGPADVNQAGHTPQNAINFKSGEVAQETVRKSKTDTVTVSSQALKLSAQLENVSQDRKK